MSRWTLRKIKILLFPSVSRRDCEPTMNMLCPFLGEPYKCGYQRQSPLITWGQQDTQGARFPTYQLLNSTPEKRVLSAVCDQLRLWSNDIYPPGKVRRLVELVLGAGEPWECFFVPVKRKERMRKNRIVDRLFRPVNAHVQCYQMIQKFGSEDNIEKKVGWGCGSKAGHSPWSRKARSTGFTSVRVMVLGLQTGLSRQACTLGSPGKRSKYAVTWAPHPEILCSLYRAGALAFGFSKPTPGDANVQPEWRTAAVKGKVLDLEVRSQGFVSALSL